MKIMNKSTKITGHAGNIIKANFLGPLGNHPQSIQNYLFFFIFTPIYVCDVIHYFLANKWLP